MLLSQPALMSRAIGTIYPPRFVSTIYNFYIYCMSLGTAKAPSTWLWNVFTVSYHSHLWWAPLVLLSPCYCGCGVWKLQYFMCELRESVLRTVTCGLYVHITVLLDEFCRLNHSALFLGRTRELLEI